MCAKYALRYVSGVYFRPYIYNGFRCKRGVQLESNLSLTRVLLLLDYENKCIHFLIQQSPSSNFLA